MDPVERAVAAAARSLDLPGRHVLVAVSGGVDSTVLAHVLHGLPKRLAIKLSIGHVNHGLRGDASEADAAAVKELAARLGLAFAERRVDPQALRTGDSSRARLTLEEAARRLRYAALHAIADELGAERIATAHTADDQAETVLLRLLRGSGPQGLGGIPEASADGRVVRPLLAVTRAVVLAHARKHGLAWREDASNADPAHARNRLRIRWLPGLAREFNPRLLRAIGDLAEAQRRDSEWIEAEVEREASRRFVPDGTGLRIRGGGWDRLPEALARRVVRRALRDAGLARDVSRAHIERALRFLRNPRPGRCIELPRGLVLVQEGGDAWLGRSGRRPPGAC